MSDSDPLISTIRRWTFDHFDQAQAVADRMNSDQRVTATMKPVRHNYEAGWGLRRDHQGVWHVRGLGL